MRLLQLTSYPSFSLTEFTSENETPPYAILSHTWGHDKDEVTYQDIIDGTGSHKAGYAKLHFCANQAKKDGLAYCWIDTCCIDKKYSPELTESINSMFRWYQNAAKCYVFLADVSTPKTNDDRDSKLRKSRWFTRSWTLQELIAPRAVEFFSQEGLLFGDKRSLEKEIQQISGISVHALRGEPLSHFSVDERMSWTAEREAKRPEDKAYSLLGIFDIQMPVIYGEGEKRARDRLVDELDIRARGHVLTEHLWNQLHSPSKLPLLKPAWLVPFERNPCFTGRESELARLEEMLFGQYHSAKLAVTGLGGVGKTQLVIELLYRVADRHEPCSILWISALNMESMHRSYLDIAQLLGIPGCEDTLADIKRLVQVHLSEKSTRQWLLVFDGADDLDMWIGSEVQPEASHPLIDYLPKNMKGTIIFTMRDMRMAVKLAPWNFVVVPVMGHEAATQLLEKSLANVDLMMCQQDTNALLEQLTYLPLAIVQAAAYMNENAISIAEYLSLLAAQEGEVIDILSEQFAYDGRYCDIKNPVATTWLVSFDRIRKHDPLAADYLSFMACLEPNDIPLSILPPGPSLKERILAIGRLNAYSFVNRQTGGECLDVNRLVHLAARKWLRKEELFTHSITRAILRLEEVFSDPTPYNRTEWRKYLAHASYALKSNVISSNDYDASAKARTSLLWKVGMCLFQE